MVIDAPKQKEEEYYEIILGDATEQGGESQPGASSEDLVTKTKLTPPPPETMNPTPSDVKTQEQEESLETPPQSKEEKIDDYQDPQEIENSQEETETQEVPEPDQDKISQEQQTKLAHELVYTTLNQSDSSDTTGTVSTNSKNSDNVDGDSQEGGYTQNPEGIIPEVPGREPIAPIPPLITNYKFEEGTIVVIVKVNEAGDVVEASTTGGTNVSDRATLELVKEHAKKIKFTEGEPNRGPITYKLTVH
jgi:outer membrane biosynthesis protein TonB